MWFGCMFVLGGVSVHSICRAAGAWGTTPSWWNIIVGKARLTCHEGGVGYSAILLLFYCSERLCAYMPLSPCVLLLWLLSLQGKQAG
jgi:hypothetical protein